MSQALQVWWVLPASVVIATIALAAGISGALFFSPFFLLVIGLQPAQAIGAGLLAELFGTSFGTFYDVLTRAIVSNKTDGFIKIVAEEGSGRILGGHILGAEASSPIHEVAAAMLKRLPADIGNTLPMPCPTFSEGVRYACQAVM